MLRETRGSARIILLMLLAGALPAQAGVAELRAAAENFAGGPVRLDPRVYVPDCAGGYQIMADATDPARLRASCVASGWQMWIPRGTAAVPAEFSLRRGQSLRIGITGAGYQASAQATVQSFDRRTGAVMLRNDQSGQIFQGQLQADGTVKVSGRKSN